MMPKDLIQYEKVSVNTKLNMPTWITETINNTFDRENCDKPELELHNALKGSLGGFVVTRQRSFTVSFKWYKKLTQMANELEEFAQTNGLAHTIHVSVKSGTIYVRSVAGTTVINKKSYGRNRYCMFNDV